MWQDPLAGTSSDPGLSTSDFSGYATDASALGVVTPLDYSLPGDSSDNQQMAAYNTAPPAAQQAGVQWWQGAVQNGISKAIDNTFPTSPTGVMGNTYAGSTAGYNGQTYTVKPLGAGGGVLGQAMGANGAMKGIPTTWLLIAAVIAFAVLHKG
jgi:hypothetical protein